MTQNSKDVYPTFFALLIASVFASTLVCKCLDDEFETFNEGNFVNKVLLVLTLYCIAIEVTVMSIVFTIPKNWNYFEFCAWRLTITSFICSRYVRIQAQSVRKAFVEILILGLFMYLLLLERIFKKKLVN